MTQVQEIETNERIEQLRAKNTEAFASLYDDYAAALFGVTCRMVGDRVVAESLLQDIFVKIWQGIDTYDPEKGRLFTWLFNIARNTCEDYLRSKSHQQEREVVGHEVESMDIRATLVFS